MRIKFFQSVSGIHLAHALGRRGSLLSLPCALSKEDMRRQSVVMKVLKRMLLAAVMLCVTLAGAFAQNRRGNDPPPKPDPPPRVKVEPNKNPPPNEGQRHGSDNNNQRRPE
ncbi:MAG: hypothetical protein AUG51_12265 [Acidobacteria bacterium 13_1_20CM_3_53_8]|nr:MAG: hypothetical protein AUG51_12265 [Acidobacteria bacterium 13_1_20CM_3_53_8]